MLNNLFKNTFTVFRCCHQKSELRVPSTWTIMLNKIRTMFFFRVFIWKQSIARSNVPRSSRQYKQPSDRVSNPVPLMQSYVSFSFKTNKARHVYTGYQQMNIWDGDNEIGHFRVPKTHFQNEAKCQTFVVKMNFVCMRIKTIFTLKTSQLASLWNGGLRQRGKGLLKEGP